MEEFGFPAIPAEQDKLSQVPSPPFPPTPIPSLPSPSTHESKFHRNYQRSRSFSCLEDLKLGDELNSTEIHDEEKMDLLWEDFNEELNREARGNNGLGFSKASSKLEGKKPQSSRELLCAKAFRHQRPGLLIIFKVFKKLLLVQKTRKERAPSSI